MGGNKNHGGLSIYSNFIETRLLIVLEAQGHRAQTAYLALLITSSKLMNSACGFITCQREGWMFALTPLEGDVSAPNLNFLVQIVMHQCYLNFWRNIFLDSASLNRSLRAT